ncbi:hypothetical protein ANO11243_036320 [Dothideomycetidae sp. 11243]|nr:hypothetical protein ANO11243_036320 [fungal sp. No.11243]
MVNSKVQRRLRAGGSPPSISRPAVHRAPYRTRKDQKKTERIEAFLERKDARTAAAAAAAIATREAIAATATEAQEGTNYDSDMPDWEEEEADDADPVEMADDGALEDQPRADEDAREVQVDDEDGFAINDDQWRGNQIPAFDWETIRITTRFSSKCAGDDRLLHEQRGLAIGRQSLASDRTTAWSTIHTTTGPTTRTTT